MGNEGTQEPDMDAVQSGRGVVKLGRRLCRGLVMVQAEERGERVSRLHSGDFRVPGTGDRRDWAKSKEIGTGRVRERSGPQARGHSDKETQAAPRQRCRA